MLARSRAWQAAAMLVAVPALLVMHGGRSPVGDQLAPTQLDVGDGHTLKAGLRLTFEATAYCKGSVTASGALVRAGVAAADPRVLPEGSVVHIEGERPNHTGIYTVLDTGPAVRGTHVDLYMWSCYEALDFGRQPVQLTVLRVGWEPRASVQPQETFPLGSR